MLSAPHAIERATENRKFAEFNCYENFQFNFIVHESNYFVLFFRYIWQRECLREKRKRET